ncbi:MAG: hypothetical protein ACREQV_04475 [Candidatus Binatia bacterium]
MSESSHAARHGTVIERRPLGGGSYGNVGMYYLQDLANSIVYSFDYRDIVTEGFRTAVVGERVRFYVDPTVADRARYVIRLDLPSVEEYYS